jgi:5'-nucleotidase
MDEAETVNAQVAELKARGVEAIVVLIHEGGFPSGGINECPGISGPIVEIVRKFDRAVDVVISGHTHRAYTCTIDGRLVTSGDKYGTLVTAIDLVLDPKTRDIASAKADNVVVHTSLAKDPAQTALIESYDRLAGPIAARPAGAITASLSRVPNAAGESALGDLVADAQLAATRDVETGDAEIAITNPGGLRADINAAADGKVTFGDVFAAQPFRNQLVTMTLTGAQLKAALELQWQDPARPRILQVSRGFSYAWDNAAAPGARIVAARMMLHNRPVEPGRSYRVTVNAYLAAGGDGFAPFTQGADRLTGVYDVDALFGYFKAHSPIAPAAQDRIERLN